MPLAGQFGTALWLAVLTAALVALGGSADPVQAQLTALPQMGWATVVAMLITWAVAMALAPKLGAVDPSAPKGM
jgi:membrane protein DedA with SNARE-associated domain